MPATAARPVLRSCGRLTANQKATSKAEMVHCYKTASRLVGSLVLKFSPKHILPDLHTVG